MAYKAGAPLVPVYLHKKDRWYQRQRIVVGEPINIVELVGKLPTKTALAAASAAVHDKELELQSYLESLPIGKKLLKKKEKILAKREKKAMKKAKREALSEKSE
jgi:hypothetical protein